MSAQQQLEEIEELARRAIACKRWRWMPGMLSAKGLRVTRRDSDGYVVGYYEDLSYIAECVAGTLPDLSDPATVGCLLALVRKAWGPDASVSVNMSGFWAVGGATVLSGKGKGASINLGIWKLTELEALVAALEVAP
jgi:hypothetical protein